MMSFRTPQSFTDAQRQRLAGALEPLHSKYDSAESSLRLPFASPGYHTTLKGGEVHPTRESLNYAVALLDTGNAEFLHRGEDILRRIVAAQDQDPQSRTYGIWSWFLEEPLSQMSPPDWNWADFCGVQLLQVALDHRQRLDTNLLGDVDAAILHSAASIQHRNVGPDYTNIAVMGTYVTLVAGELFDRPDFIEYGLQRLKRLHDYTVETGGFTEFNSPNYTLTAIDELGRLRLHVQSAEARPFIEALYHRAWEEAARHFHPPTRQWAGPHSRSYQTLLSDQQLGVVERAVSRPLDWNKSTAHSSLSEHRLPLPCPSDLEHYFFDLQEEGDLVTPFLTRPPELIGTTCLARKFAVGSINRGDLWNQRRSLVAYWGTPERPSYLHVRFIHDGYDFAAAQFFSSQRRGRVLAGVNFALDGGDTHLHFDRMKAGEFFAREMKLRFEFGGAAKEVVPEINKSSGTEVQVAFFDDVLIEFASFFSRFGAFTPRWEISRSTETLSIDLVLYAGELRAFLLSTFEAGIVFGLSVSADRTAFPRPEVTESQAAIQVSWDTLQLWLPIQAATIAMLQNGNRPTQ